MSEELLSSQKAAAILKVAVSTVKRWTDEGLLPCTKTDGARIFQTLPLKCLGVLIFKPSETVRKADSNCCSLFKSIRKKTQFLTASDISTGLPPSFSPPRKIFLIDQKSGKI